MAQATKATAAACSSKSCDGCSIEGKLLCIHTRKDLADFAVLFIGWVIPFFAGMVIGGFWTALAVWVGLALIFFGCLCTLGIWMKRALPVYIFGTLSLFGLAFICMPGHLKSVHTGWMNISRLIGRVLTALILTLAYYMVITPSALIKRIFGGCPLPVSPDKNASSYWVTRTEAAQQKERFPKRY